MSKLSDYVPALRYKKPNADLGGEGTTSAPSYLKLVSADGTEYFIFCANDGTLREHTSAPTSNTSGSVVSGAQGAQGDAGAQGAQGAQGPQGAQGAQGAAG
ncbi:MAG: hypothetical protein ACP5NS_05095 [Candidatus Pacearchaeota archaeon]